MKRLDALPLLRNLVFPQIAERYWGGGGGGSVSSWNKEVITILKFIR